MSERDERARARDRIADERDHAADERDRIANERDRAADERERQDTAAGRELADDRERASEERERIADDRERAAEERDQRTAAFGHDEAGRDAQTEHQAAAREHEDTAERLYARGEDARAVEERELAQGERESAGIAAERTQLSRE